MMYLVDWHLFLVDDTPYTNKGLRKVLLRLLVTHGLGAFKEVQKEKKMLDLNVKESISGLYLSIDCLIGS